MADKTFHSLYVYKQLSCALFVLARPDVDFMNCTEGTTYFHWSSVIAAPNWNGIEYEA